MKSFRPARSGPAPTTGPRRRALLRAAAVGLAAPALAGCVTSGGDDGQPAAAKGETSAENPLGVPASTPLEVVIFDGGYGDEYAVNAENIYKGRFPGATVEHKAIQKVGEALQPRFVADTPPDVVDNTGAGRLDLATLVGAGKLTDLTELLDAPSLDDPGTKVRDTLLPGVVADGTLDGRVYTLNFTYTVWGLWYSKPLFDRHGWAYPTSWDAMLALCAEIKKAGIAPWTYQGKYPEYLNDPLLAMAAKAGGPELVKAVDNLQPGAWKQQPLLDAATAIAELAGRGYLLPGSEALSHTEAQAAWSQGKAAIIPCGSWLEAEQKGVTPAGFDMVMGAVPSLGAADKLPYGTVQAASSESFLVPARAKNPRGGLEFLRVLFSSGSARRFAELNSTLPSVAGATDGLTLSTGLGSVRAAVQAAGANTVSYRFRTWYAPLAKAVDDATGELATRRITPAQWADRIQKAADAIAADSAVTKYTR
ncbi:carbohydrate ABC transporter, N-acetylglucosamine/diacetylchitobiose-binding protein [Plantactinospora sp. BC1]|uniref:N-acetylglucosamine/diacetylchitobiose ABC transporter substrate-binding protein n=1 Tax=Plantactinospora sp. BC1 TaxID=2108470 RepID=UPI000D16ACDC|nr:N-acetylglucosamine/diacetylchitobiose ABC transporter substrate-binding protein [Plantactinospora sp. BC1]AVT31752.1 carbohydrate ABC transporter, N-acetylglucosamine/diacetylchitobiose-binding protein [Plantactinospora sp. BC1]